MLEGGDIELIRGFRLGLALVLGLISMASVGTGAAQGDGPDHWTQKIERVEARVYYEYPHCWTALAVHGLDGSELLYNAVTSTVFAAEDFENEYFLMSRAFVTSTARSAAPLLLLYPLLLNQRDPASYWDVRGVGIFSKDVIPAVWRVHFEKTVSTGDPWVTSNAVPTDETFEAPRLLARAQACHNRLALWSTRFDELERGSTLRAQANERWALWRDGNIAPKRYNIDLVELWDELLASRVEPLELALAAEEKALVDLLERRALIADWSGEAVVDGPALTILFIDADTETIEARQRAIRSRLEPLLASRSAAAAEKKLLEAQDGLENRSRPTPTGSPRLGWW